MNRPGDALLGQVVSVRAADRLYLRERARQMLANGGPRLTRVLARMCALWDLGKSMRSNVHLGIRPMSMTHVLPGTPVLGVTPDRQRSMRTASFAPSP